MNKGTRQLLTELHEDDSAKVSVIFDTEDEFDRITANDTVFQPYECTVIFDGALDEEFIIATDNLELVHQAMMKDIIREYLDNPNSGWGWSIEWHEVDSDGERLGHEGDSPKLQHRFSPDPVFDVRGCSCGMADYGAPGHDGHR